MWLLLLSAAAGALAAGPPPPPSPSAPATAADRDVGACRACRTLVDSFRAGLARTARGKFDGGDAAWEEQRLGSYARSELRLVEIQERLCGELERHKERCHALAELAEPHFEEWWTTADPNSDDPFAFVCVEKLRACCPPHRFGERCDECAGGVETPCSGNGRCRGDGTRKGNGTCACEPGYVGEVCDACAESHFEAYRDGAKLVCSPCHAACATGCSRSGAGGCFECAEGWSRHGDEGCRDVNECTERDACADDQFCVNAEGTYTCVACDRSCDGCHGDGPSACRRCAKAYQFEADTCVDSNVVERSRTVIVTRYLTYFGLCVTTCIIFQKSTALAGALGAVVALYITVSEYMLADNPNGLDPTPALRGIDFSKLFTNQP